jgi:hypothetical protein
MFLDCFYACACQVHDCVFFVFIIDDIFASWVLFFQDALIFRNAITLCYNTQFVALQSRLPFLRTLAICEVVMKIMSLSVNGYVLNHN